MIDFTDQFNTPLNAEDENNFQLWAASQSDKRGRDITQDLGDYDLRGYWANEGFKSPSNGIGHLPDTYKKPSHPTFSDESIYHGIDHPSLGKLEGGHWNGNDKQGWSFIPSASMLTKTHNVDEMKNYFQRFEPDSQLVLP